MQNPNVKILEAQTWQEVVTFFQQTPQYIYRGQGNSNWELSTNLERTCQNNRYPKNFLDNREKVILREFQRRAHHYLQNPPNLNNKLEWFSLLQHFGGPTRLLDFTKSFYIAAFFAIESSSTDSAIWALHDDYLYQHTENVVSEGQTIFQLQEESRKIVEENLSHQHVEPIVMAVEPESLNERIAIQQGLFLIQGSLYESFQKNLAITYNLSQEQVDLLQSTRGESISNYTEEDFYDVEIVKMILPSKIHNEAIHDLNAMNINASTLFPGIDGFAQSLKIHLRDVQ